MLNFSPEPVRGRHVLAALSGGADSVALLLLLCRARDEGILTLSAAHFDHGIRGAESRADAEFCQSLCRERDVPLFTGKGRRARGGPVPGGRAGILRPTIAL